MESNEIETLVSRIKEIRPTVEEYIKLSDKLENIARFLNIENRHLKLEKESKETIKMLKELEEKDKPITFKLKVSDSDKIIEFNATILKSPDTSSFMKILINSTDNAQYLKAGQRYIIGTPYLNLYIIKELHIYYDSQLIELTFEKSNDGFVSEDDLINKIAFNK
jgi:hypothetical protein